MKNILRACLLAVMAFCFIPLQLLAQENKGKVSFTDNLDGYLDLSDFIINQHGFVPVPIIITEPALGGFGGGIVPVFIKKNPPVEKDGKFYPVPPDIAAAGGMYTANESWMAFGGIFGSIKKYNLKYKAAGGYADVNMSYYHHFPALGEDKEFKFNMKGAPLYVYLGKQFADPRFQAGLDYMFIKGQLKLTNSPSVMPNNWADHYDTQVAKVGVSASFDSRDNVFTPNKGVKTALYFDVNNEVLGSDYNYQHIEYAFYWYQPVTERWISGFRFDFQQIIGDAPFFIKPYIDMRGVPTMRYQGNTTALIELEERFDFGKTKRWSAVVFGGAGKGFESMDDFDDAEWAWGYGAGARYLLARKLNLRMGVDVAMGPEGPAYYIIFGSGWMRQ
jgi:hypothetical protein